MVKFRTGNAERNHHECNLRYGGEGEYALDVDLRAGYYGCVEGGESTDYHDDIEGAVVSIR